MSGGEGASSVLVELSAGAACSADKATHASITIFRIKPLQLVARNAFETNRMRREYTLNCFITSRCPERVP